MPIATTMIKVASTRTCGGISTFAESKISRGNVDTPGVPIVRPGQLSRFAITCLTRV
jgi:hypothetical protein